MAGHLGAETQAYAFVRLDPGHERIGPRVTASAGKSGRCGGRRNSMTTSVVRRGRHFPVLMYTGTPAHRQLSMCRFSATKVSVELSGSTPSSSR